MKKAAIILVNYKDYAKRYLPDCIESLRKQDYKESSLFIVDNETSEESFNYIKETVSPFFKEVNSASNPPNPLFKSPQPPLSRGQSQGGNLKEVLLRLSGMRRMMVLLKGTTMP